MSELSSKSAQKFITTDFSIGAADDFLATLQPHEFDKKIEANYTYFLAESDNTLIGFIGMKDFTHLYHLYVDENHHNQGIARLLWQKACDYCQLNGRAGEFTVNSSLYAQAFYEKLGFVARSEPQDRNGIIYVPMMLTQ